MRQFSLYAMIALYALAGVNHFWHPLWYQAIIPPYLPSPRWINIAAGLSELICAGLLLYAPTRQAGSYLVIAMLVAFLPAHVYFIQINHCGEGGLCLPTWIGWARLIVGQPLLIWWAYSVRRA